MTRLLSRADFCSALALSVSGPFMPLPAHSLFYQADDKSFDLQIPNSWRLDSTAARRLDPASSGIFRVQAGRDDGVGLALTVDFMSPVKVGMPSPKVLADLGSLEKVGNQFLVELPQPASLLETRAASGTAFMAAKTYEYRCRIGSGGLVMMKQSAQQGRVYRLIVTLPPEPTVEQQAEADSIIGSFKVFPLNIGCLKQSNQGLILPGVCY
mmetsp:Transcript_68881/g.114472  ORF Transcript_68881/g.114472 Transcript_68881/m.114472 type:complete len:211 (+) Transcript_68881:43-675(+)|eukprot:CAMPEP_0119316024 /NCGR_PEP_ID=MMETSP1333-20130426/38175_1 /TAXON_ID=418940 /ORGANISM="Scyphosphaera apsteinii, Strain RCC1455" /LENGTH=210 /DNA_ID=CAMNT_0007321555 /DNA_START=42 /DNA_END=677 /DNA_ORIENTATION=+